MQVETSSKVAQTQVDATTTKPTPPSDALLERQPSVSATVALKDHAAKTTNVTKTPTNSQAQKRRLQDVGTLQREDFDGGPVSLDEIVPGLYLGNLTAATHIDTLKKFKITHILTLDSVPLPEHITRASFLTTKYVHIADMPKEDILHHLDTCTEFISAALVEKGNVLVHCYFGVSRSSAAVIAFIMKEHDIDYQSAYELVRSKRRFVQPNAGFVSQLKLYRRMGCKIDTQYQRYKLYRLRLAGEQVRKAKILPQAFNNLIKPDPAVTQANPEPIVYRCRKCRRILASKSHVLLHNNKMTPTTATAQPMPAPPPPLSLPQSSSQSSNEVAMPRLLEQIATQMRKASLGSPPPNDGANADITAQTAQSPAATCQNIIFVEPISWMRNITHNTQGRLNCPKCDQKVGNFSWINGCQCPCGEEVSPAFYLIPSRVELSKAVQNVQTTL